MNDNEEMISRFHEYLKRRGMSDYTAASYQSAVRQLLSLSPTVSVESLRVYREWLLSRYRPATVNARVSAVNSYLAFLENPSEQTGPDLDPDLPLLPALQPEPSSCRLASVRLQQTTYLDSVISEEDYERLKSSLLADGNMEWYFLVHFLGSTGVRVGELIQIKAEHLRLGYMDLYSKGGKVRRIYFPEALCRKALAWYAAHGRKSGFLFTNRRGRPLTPRGINSRLKRLAVLYQIDPATVYPHSFRHRFAKNFLKKFNDISLLADLLGHESIETTRIYLTKSSLEQREVIDRIVTW